MCRNDNIYSTSLISSFAALTLLFCLGCATPAAVQAKPDLKQQIDSLGKEIGELIAEGQCNQDRDCDSIAMGNKSCGGPSFYLPYSKIGTDVTKIQELATRHRALSKKYNAEQGMISDCMMLMPPSVMCSKQICIKKVSK